MTNIQIIRHGEVATRWKKICYGASDVPLSEAGKQASQALAERLVNEVMPDAIYHSGLMRTSYLAQLLADNWNNEVCVVADARLRERNYGQWQGMSWDDAYASDPDNFHHLTEKPDTYRPPQGETTTEMQNRVVQWHKEVLENRPHQNIIAVCHSGPIAALAGWLTQTPATNWEPWLLKPLESLKITDSTIQVLASKRAGE